VPLQIAPCLKRCDWGPGDGTYDGLRLFACSACGTEFACGLSGTCWCAEETVRLPMPVASEDCLCRDCLRKLAADASRNTAG
jgi:hypothetical protein